MALFSKFKKAKEAAVEHKKSAAAQEAKPPAAPYKHVPTHAEQDALAAQPTKILRPDELQARIAKARKRRASSYQSPVTTRHSVYHSCESSRMSSRTDSTAGFVSASTSSSITAHRIGDSSIDAVMRRSQSASHQRRSTNTVPDLHADDYLSSSPVGHPSFPPPAPQRPRLYQSMSSRSSYTMKKSPLSNVSVEEETVDIHSNSSDTSAVSKQSSGSEKSRIYNHTSHPNTAHTMAAAVFDKPISTIDRPRDATLQSTKRRSRWSILPRKNAAITAH
ncbi:hypothetical protein EK21DRAFT_91949 [Setomelanomma holmii]|uniref:Uncharacterized protein n=1 Tax=Setomelanomma holmii TaxID=210430 RepID=A0A9P4LKD6_9PLEO|nr:hypothetical protein EK21DRAFT_91949 [Setomelanomma holmii]